MKDFSILVYYNGGKRKMVKLIQKGIQIIYIYRKVWAFNTATTSVTLPVVTPVARPHICQAQTKNLFWSSSNFLEITIRVTHK